MKARTAFVILLTGAALFLTATPRAADTDPAQSGTTTVKSDQKTETPSERILRLAGDQTKSVPLSDYNVNWKTLSNGAGVGSNSTWTVAVTFGQPIAGSGANSQYTVSTGFWQQFGSGSCCLMRGDMDRSGWYSISDVTFLVNFLARGGEAPGCIEEGDVDASGELNIADLTFLVAFLFQQGALPPAC